MGATKEDNELVLLVIIGIAVMLLLMVSLLIILVMHQRKRLRYRNEVQKLRDQQKDQLIESAVKSEEGERHRIAEQLHDEVGAILSSTRLHFSNIKQADLDERDKTLYDKSKLLLDDAIEKVRSISHNLHSSLLTEFGLNEAIRHFLTKTVQGTLIKVETDLDDNYLVQKRHTDIGLYRIVQELVNNMIKHAKASVIRVKTVAEKDKLTLTLLYNGQGLTQQQFEELRYKQEGLGLKNIMNRIILLKGDIIYSVEGNENKIELTIPLEKNEDKISHSG
jgi:two-component system, NarL family, sensor kinase